MRDGLLDHGSIQRMLYDALDHSDDIVLFLEQRGERIEDIVLAAANDAYRRTAGFDGAELIGRELTRLFAAEADQARCTELVRAVQRRSSFRTEILCARQNGAPFWFGVHLMPVHDTEPPCFVMLGRDITDVLQARQQQQAIQGLLAKVFVCVQAPVAIVSDDGIIQMANPALEQMLGRKAGSLVGRPALDSMAADCRDAIATVLRRQLEDGRNYTAAARLVREDGSEVAVDVTSTVTPHEDLRRFRIITALKRANELQPMAVQVAGKIRLVGLDTVKQALGSRWEELAARVMATAEHIVRRVCGVRDTFARTPDNGFLICFADASEEEASFRAAALARDIRARLIGEGESEDTAIISAIAAQVEVPKLASGSQDMQTTVIGERLNARLAEIEARARATLGEAVVATRRRLEPVRRAIGKDVIGQFVRLPDRLEQQVLAAYSALPTRERKRFDFDRLVLGLAASEAVCELASGTSTAILVNVDFEVCLDRHRTERYVADCRALDARLRERLIPVLSGIPKGVPRSRVLDFAIRLKPYCQSVAYQCTSIEMPPVEGAVLHGAIVVLGEQHVLNDPNEGERFARLVNSLHAHQASVMVRRVARKAVGSLAQLGVDLVSVVQDERESEG